jgi:hypothetical protein
LSEIEDRKGINEAISKHAWALDRGDLQGLLAVFTSDGGIVHPNGDGFHGEEGLTRWLNLVLSQPGHYGRQHWTRPMLWEKTAEGYTVVSYWIYLLHIAGEPPKIGGQGYYRDKFVKQNGRWLFQEKYVDHWSNEKAPMSESFHRVQAAAKAKQG